MSPQAFATAPGTTGMQRKFVNPTGGYVGANVYGPDGKPTAVPVEPGGEVWLTAEEERMTAEAPRMAQDNPFIKEWEEAVEWDPVTGEPARTITRQGVLVLSDEPPRPVASDRFIPDRDPVSERGLDSSADLDETRALLAAKEAELAAREAALAEREAQPEPETVKGADVPDRQPPVQGQPSETEVVGTPEAPDANDEALAMREPTAEQPTTGSGIPID